MKPRTCKLHYGALVVTVLLLSAFVDPAPSKAGRATPSVDSLAEALDYSKTVGTAKEAARHGDNERAVELFDKALAISQADPGLYVDLADALFALKRYPQAAAAYEKARSFGFYERANSAEQIAACFLLAGDKNSALNWLEEALRSRLKERPGIAGDERFTALGNEPRFKQIIGTLPAGITNRMDGWNYDLDFLVSEIHRLNPVYTKELPEEFHSRMATLRQHLASLTDQEIGIEIMALFALLHQGHTVMAPFGMQKGVLGHIPIQLYEFSDGIFVIDAPEANGDLIGAQVLAINGVDVSVISKNIEPYISRDNDYFLHFAVPIALTWPDLLKATGVTIEGEFVEFKVRKGGSVSTERLQTLPAIDPEKLAMKLIAPKVPTTAPPDYLSHLDKNFWLKPIDNATLYVQINQCVDEEKKTLDQFADELDHAVKTGKPHYLILDVRLNNGGNYSKMFSVLKVLFSFERMPNARLFIIAGRNTLSAAQNFINTLDQFGGAIFVGEPSGSRPDHVGDDTMAVLPYSGIIGSIACALHQTDFRDQREWIAPNLPIMLSSEAYFSQRDPIVEAIMKFIATN